MTALLSPTAQVPFSSDRERVLHFFGDTEGLAASIPPASARSLTNLNIQRQFSPASQRSTASAPSRSRCLQSNENLNPVEQSAATPGLESECQQSSCGPPLERQSDELRLGSCVPTRNVKVGEKQLRRKIDPSTERRKHLFQRMRPSNLRFLNDSPPRGKQESQNTSCVVKLTPAKPLPLVDAINEPFPDLRDSFELQSIENSSTEALPRSLRIVPPISFSRTPQGILGHRQRDSNASSAFVHTIKTASMSNGSFSIEPRSVRIGRSSESRGHFGHQPRYSLDSDRRNAEAVLDDAAFRRGLRRKQIIHELILTEESYVADLKALVYLYSTLLASATTMSNETRIAIQRNLTELLHIHETLVHTFHYATYKAAARKWVDTATPTRLASTYQRNTGRILGHSGPNRHNHTRSSIDSAEVSRVQTVIGIAEPAEVLDLAEIVNDALAKFCVYQEYGAVHKTIAIELQKQSPELWTTYESGLESLNQSLMALNRRRHQHKKGLTVGDLLIKPIQRICRYPLLLEDLLKYTPVADSPAAHEALEKALNHVRCIAQAVNITLDNDAARDQVQRRVLLRNRLRLDDGHLTSEQFRALGSLQLCGVLFVTYQNAESDVQGIYCVCALFDEHFLIAIPQMHLTVFSPMLVIPLTDIVIETSAGQGGLLPISSLHTWKVIFSVGGKLHEIVLSACSRTEETQWIDSLRANARADRSWGLASLFDQARIFVPLKSHTLTVPAPKPVPGQGPALYQRYCAAVPTPPQPIRYPVILRNTYNAQDWQDYRNITPLAISKLNDSNVSKDILTLSPKRAERTRLENAMSEIYTKDKLAFPGMVESRRGHMIRASAGSLVRKLSFASLQASFSRRSTSLSSRKSYHTIHTVPAARSAHFTVRKQSFSNHPDNRQRQLREIAGHRQLKDLAELDKVTQIIGPEDETMDKLIKRMIGDNAVKKKFSFSDGPKLARRSSKTQGSLFPLGPEDPATYFYQVDKGDEVTEQEQKAKVDRKNVSLESGLGGTKKKRWSNPIAKLRGFGGDSIINKFYSSK